MIDLFQMFHQHKINVTNHVSNTLQEKSLVKIKIVFKINDIDELSKVFIYIKKNTKIVHDIVRK